MDFVLSAYCFDAIQFFKPVSNIEGIYSYWIKKIINPTNIRYLTNTKLFNKYKVK